MGPLASIKVLDFTSLLPGPFATMLLADLGAEVLRVESPHRVDLLRLVPPCDESGNSAAHEQINRSKRSIALDLKKPQAAEIVRRLVTDHDVVLEGFRPGVMERLGVGYEELARANPRLIYCSLTGYGQTGPLHRRAGHDCNYLALAGVLGYSGWRDGGPAPLGIPFADLSGSLHAVIAILAAVIHRRVNGEGQHVDLAITDAAFAMNAPFGAGYLAAGVEPEREATQLNGGTFYGYFRTRDGRFLSVGGLEPQFRQRLCEAIGRPDLLATAMSVDPEDERDFKAAVEGEIGRRALGEWQETFQRLDACVEPVLSFAEATRHPQVEARRMIVDVPMPGGGTQRQLASPFRFSRTAVEYRHAGHACGADTLGVLRELDYADSEIESLIEAGVFGSTVGDDE